MKGLWKMLVKPERGTTVFYCELLTSHFVTYFITRFVLPVVTPSEPIFFFFQKFCRDEKKAAPQRQSTRIKAKLSSK